MMSRGVVDPISGGTNGDTCTLTINNKTRNTRSCIDGVGVGIIGTRGVEWIFTRTWVRRAINAKLHLPIRCAWTKRVSGCTVSIHTIAAKTKQTQQQHINTSTHQLTLAARDTTSSIKIPVGNSHGTFITLFSLIEIKQNEC